MKAERLAVRHIAKNAYRTKILISALAIVLASTMLILFAVFATGMLTDKKGLFEISSFDSEDGRISLSNTADFAEPTVRLTGEAIDNMTNISGSSDIPDNIHSIAEGSHNGANYFAYTFYMRNTGETTINVEERINLLSKLKGAEKAARVKVYRDGAPTTYAALGKSGDAEYGTVPFIDDSTVYARQIKELAPGETIKYTLVIWLEGDDPDCTDDILGGYVRFSMDFKVINASGEDAN